MRKEMSTEELLVRYSNGERDFAGIKLFDEKLIYHSWDNDRLIDLKGVDLSGSNLCGADFGYVDLTGANLAGAEMRGIYLYRSLLCSAVLTDANLLSANLRDCDLTDANLDNSCLDNINAINACFKGSILPAFECANLADASFRNARTTKQLLCRGANIIWFTVMPDGDVITGPQVGDGQGR